MHGVAEELAVFLVWLDAFDAALATNSTFVLDPAFAPWHLGRMGATPDANGIPMPAESEDALAGGN